MDCKWRFVSLMLVLVMVANGGESAVDGGDLGEGSGGRSGGAEPVAAGGEEPTTVGAKVAGDVHLGGAVAGEAAGNSAGEAEVEGISENFYLISK